MRVLLLALPVLLITGCHIPRYSHQRIVEKEIESSPLTGLSLKTFNGSITVEPNADNRVIMEATYKAYGESEEAAVANCEQIQTEIGGEDGTLTLRALKPKGQWMASASFKLLVPVGCVLDLNTSNGTVTVVGNEAGVEVTTSNGTVHLERIRGSATAKTSNGKIVGTDIMGPIDFSTSNGSVTLAGFIQGDENKIHTSNGSVKIRLPVDSIVQVKASTSNGSIRCELPTQRIMVQKKRSYEAIVGDGSLEGEIPKLKISTSNGSVKINPILDEEMPETTEFPEALEVVTETTAEVSAEISL